MKRDTYSTLVAALKLPVSSLPNFRLLKKKCENVQLESLISIWSLENQYHNRKHHPHHMARLKAYSTRYLDGEDIIELSYNADLPPCMMIRRLLEFLLALTKQKISEVLRDPAALPRLCAGGGHKEAAGEVSDALVQRLQADVTRCIQVDLSHSPYMDAVRQSVGVEYELKLCRLLHEEGISFWSEDELRSQGFFKTPDARLQVPIMVCGRIVHWIDSKATFGDDHQHAEYGQKQFSTYINRYGVGMVIYWFGFIDDLSDPNVLLMDHFPTTHEIKKLPQLPC